MESVVLKTILILTLSLFLSSNVLANASAVCVNRVADILVAEFNYDVTGSIGVSSVIPSLCAKANEIGASYYSAAIMAMLVAMNSLGVNDSDPEIKREIEEFIKENSLKVLQLASKRGDQPLDHIKGLISGIVTKHGLRNPD